MKVIITIEDTEERSINISTEFDPPLKRDEPNNSAAAHCAARFLEMIRNEAQESSELEEE